MQVDLTDSRLFASNAFWPVLAWLREHDPVHRHALPDGSFFWAVTRHADVTAVYADDQTYSSRFGMRLDSNASAVAAVSQRMLIVSDPPEHTELKRVLSPFFGPAELPTLEALVASVIPQVLEEAIRSGEVEFLEVAKRIPNYVVCALMEIPRSDWDWVGTVTTAAFEGSTEQERSGAHSEIFLFFTELLDERRRRPGTDLISQIAAAHRSGSGQRPLSDEEIVFNANGILAGANETTRYSAAGAVLALVDNPEQWRLLRESGPELIPTATEEVLRWTTPGVHAMRTAVRSGTIAGVPIASGDRVTLWNSSANRDPAVFAEPDRFRLDRTPNRHLAFGAGRHLCLGARLAKLELGLFLSELRTRVAELRLVGEPRYNASNFTWGLCSLPVELVPDRTAPAPVGRKVARA